MNLKVNYVYRDNRSIRKNTIFINADINEATPDSEVDHILEPLISKGTGHHDIKIISYSEA